ncbi:MAG: lamin tail domain-containing protein, partial [Anaerolineae bacterium]
VDEWVELLIRTSGLDLAGWTIELLDTSPLTGDLTSSGAFQVSRYLGTGSFTNTQVGDRLLLGNVAGSGAMNNAVFIVLKDVTGAVIDDVEIGFDPEGDGDDGAPAPGTDGNATGPEDEVIARMPDGVDTDDDVADFVQQPASIGYSNDAAPPTVTPTPTTTPTSTPTPAPEGAVLINEVVTDPQQDWNDSAGGDGIPFNAVPGSGGVTSTDEWVELLNTTRHSIDLTGWSLVMNDTTPDTEVLGEGSAVFQFSAGGSLTNFRPGERLVIGNPKGVLNNDVYLQLRDGSGHVVDDVEIGDDFEEDGGDGAPGPEQNGDALTIYDEAIARVPDGQDSDDDRADFEKWPATIGADNGRPRTGRLAQLPSLDAVSETATCDTSIDIQNLGAMSAKAIVLFWGDAGNCPPQCTGPFDVACTGLLKPGTSWHLGSEQLPSNARAGAAFSAFGQPHPAFKDGQDVFADALCDALFDQVLADCEEYRRFRLAFDQRGEWDPGRGHPDFNFAAFPSQTIAVDVTRRCRTEAGPWFVDAYTGVRGRELGRFDPLFGGFAYYAPVVYAGWRGWDSVLYIQNAGLECTSVELWFRVQGECRRSQIC